MADSEDCVIKVFYTCDACGVEKAVVDMPARSTETIGEWMKILGQCLGEHHSTNSPNCTATELTEVWIPLTGREKIDGPIVH